MPVTLASLLPSIAALAAVLAAIVLAGRLLRRSRFGRRLGDSPGRLTVADTVALDARRRLVMIRCDQRCAVLLLGPTDQVVGWVPATPP